MKIRPALFPAFAFFFFLTATHVFAQQSTPPPPPPPPPPAATSAPKPPGKVIVDGKVMAAKRIDQTVPVYPADAQKANVSGKVVLKVTVSKFGLVTGETVVSTDSPLLTQSALDAVKKFRYAPTLLNGEPVSVLTTVTVVYDLASKSKP